MMILLLLSSAAQVAAHLVVALVGMAVSSSVTIRLLGLLPAPSTSAKMLSTGKCGYEPGVGCIPRPKVTLLSAIGTRQPRPISKGTKVLLYWSNVLVEVSRLPRKTREPQVLWLWYSGSDANTPDLDLLWRSYVRRFDLEHTFRFLKQTLNWTAPRVRLPHDYLSKQTAGVGSYWLPTRSYA
jgi:hypothetical protein